MIDKIVNNSSVLLFLAATLIFTTHPLQGQQPVRYEPIPETNSFVLVVDVSGSMAGEGVILVREGVSNFLRNLRPNDKVGLIVFSSQVTIAAEIGTNVNVIIQKMSEIRARGATKLYDAMAMAWKVLSSEDTRRIIVYLTDGRDTGSNFTSANLRPMFQGSNVYVYGIGLGTEIDRRSLVDISEATNGDFLAVSDGDRASLVGIYSQIITSYYQKYPTSGVANQGALLVRSLPPKKTVSIDGHQVGLTPYIKDNIAAKKIEVTVRFAQDRIWKAPVEIRPRYRAVVDAREADALQNIWILSQPRDATVFIDGEYMGNTSSEPITPRDRRWVRQATTSPATLKVIGLKPGMHRIEVIGLPDFDYGPEQKMNIEYYLQDDEVLHFDIFSNKATTGSGEEIEGVQREDVFMDEEDFMNQ